MRLPRSLALASLLSVVACGGMVADTTGGGGDGPNTPGDPRDPRGPNDPGVPRVDPPMPDPQPQPEPIDPRVAELGALDGNFGWLAADATSFYVAAWRGSVLRLPRAGGAPTVLDPSDGSYLTGIAVDDTHVYWTRHDHGEVVRVAKGGGPVEVLASGHIGAEHIRVAGDRLYWDDSNDLDGYPPPPNGAQIVSMPKAGGAPVVLADGLPSINALTVDGGYVYFADIGGFMGRINRLPASGGALQTLLADVPGIFTSSELVVGGGYIGWIAQDGLSQLPVTGGAVRRVMPDADAILGRGLATDGKAFYIGRYTPSGGEILAFDIGSSAYRTIATPSTPAQNHWIGNALVADGASVAWLDSWADDATPLATSRLRITTR